MRSARAGLLATLLAIGLSATALAQCVIPLDSLSAIPDTAVCSQVRELYSDDPIERGYAAQRLGRMGKRATPATLALIGMLGDWTSVQWVGQGERGGHDSPAQIAARSLDRLSPRWRRGPLGSRATAIWATRLWHSEVQERVEAVRALGEIHGPGVVDTLLLALDEDTYRLRTGHAWQDHRVKEAIIHALGRCGDPRAIPAFVALLNWTYVNEASQELDSLMVQHRDAVFAAVIAGLESQPGQSSRESKLLWLRYHRDPRAVEALVRALADPNSQTRGVALQTLASYADPRALAGARQLLSDPEESVRRCAAAAVSQIEALLAQSKR